MGNNKFGKWVVVSLAEPDQKNCTRYLCRCDCGFEKIQYLRFLKAGKTTQCKNCLLKQRINNRLKVGSKFGKWTVSDVLFNETKTTYKIICECGKVSQANLHDLKNKKTTKCIECYNQVRINPSKSHGLSNSKVYKIWRAIKDRCLNPNNKDYSHYGGRGINICSEWLKFENFYKDMGDQPKGMQIDRINNNKGYFKENCRWVTPKENCNNRRKKGEG